MAIIKRYNKKNGQKKTCYQAEVYVKGVRLKCKTFKQRTEAYIWHDKEKENLLRDPSELRTYKENLFFSDCFKKYLKEAYPLLQISTQQSFDCRFRYFTEGPIFHFRMEHLNAPICSYMD